MCLAKCLKFPKFEAGCAYELYAYKKKRVCYLILFVQLSLSFTCAFVEGGVIAGLRNRSP